MLTAGLATRPLALLSDVHGNLAALEAVAAELERRGVTDVLVAGDHLLGGAAPLQTWRLLQKLEARCTRGPSDEALGSIEPGALSPQDDQQRSMAARFVETRREIGELVVEQLRRLPDKLRIPMVDGGELLLVHGSPADPQVEIGHDLTDDEVYALIGDDPADIVVCGATHVPYDRQLDGVRVVNVGSVGAAPEGGVAHFSILTPRMEGPVVEQTWVELPTE